MKSNRHEKILEIIKNNNVYTQEELLNLLKGEGHDVTQATVSRDIKELRLIKSIKDGGKYKCDIDSSFEGGIDSILLSYILKVETAMNLVVLKTSAGMAQAVCASIDSVSNDDIVGSLAGDDTIFLATNSLDNANSVANIYRDLLSGR